MPVTRSKSRLVVPDIVPLSVQPESPSAEPPAKRTRSRTKTIGDSLNTTKKPRTSHSNEPKTTVAISPEDTVAPKGMNTGKSSFAFFSNSSPLRIRAFEVNDEPLPPGVVDIFARDLLGGVLTSTIGSSPYFWQCESFHQGFLSHLHMTHYGRDYLVLLRVQESREIRDVEKTSTLPLRHRISPLSRTRKSQFHQADEDSVTSDDSENIDVLEEDEENDITSDDDNGEVRSHNVSRYRARNDVSTRLPRQKELTVQMRRVLVQWMSEVAKEFNLSEATFHLAVTLLDQLLVRGPGGTESSLKTVDHNGTTFVVHRNEFQALGCACMWMASKLEDRTPPDIRDLEYISDYSVTPSQMRALEAKICSALSFRLHRVTPFHYVHVYLRASEEGRDPLMSGPLRSMTLYLLELSRYSFRLSDQPASVIAAACVYLARATLGIHGLAPAVDDGRYWTKTLEYYTGYKMDDLKVIVLCLHSIQISAESSSIGVAPAYGNYRTEANFRVSTRTVRRVEDLGFPTTFFHDSLATNPTTRAVQIPAFHL